MLSLTHLFVAGLSSLPKPFVRSLSFRYIAGETIDAALARLAEINRSGHPGILDILGEDEGGGDPADKKQRARSALAQYKNAATRLAESGHQAYISVKPTHFGLHVSEELCFETFDELALHCADLDLFLRVEMEDHPTTDATLRVFARLLQQHAAVGIVLQSRLFRTPSDIIDLIAGTPPNRRLDVRLVKGIYLEPERIAHTEYKPIADAFIECARTLWKAGARISLATHDEIMAQQLDMLRVELEIGPDLYEYEVLLGVRRNLWKTWMFAGHPVRVYIPFGPDWHAYSMRRLKKNPKLLRQIVLGIFRR